MRRLLAILVTSVGWLACDDHGAASLTSIKTQVCACTTASCAEQAIQQVPQREIASNHRTQTIARDMLDCLAKLQAAERPSTDPDEEASEPGAPAAAAAPGAAPGAGSAPGTAAGSAPGAAAGSAPAAGAAPAAAPAAAATPARTAAPAKR